MGVCNLIELQYYQTSDDTSINSPKVCNLIELQYYQTILLNHIINLKLWACLGFDRDMKYLNAFGIDKSRYDYQIINLTDNRMLAVA